MAYVPQTWVNGPAGNTPTSAERFNYMEAGIVGAYSAVPNISSQVPSIDELFVSTYLGSITVNYYQALIAPFPLRIAGVSFMTQVDVPSSTTDNYLFNLRRCRANTYTTFASKTTNVADGAGGQGISAYTDWNYDNIPFNASVAQFAKGDALLFTMAVNAGAPAVTTLTRSTITVRYVPL